jgi:hypothetical protein
MSSSGMWLSMGVWPWLWTAFLAERISSLWCGPLRSSKAEALAGLRARYPLLARWQPRALATGLLLADLALASWCVTQLELPPPLEGLALVEPRWVAVIISVLALAGCIRLWRLLFGRLSAASEPPVVHSESPLNARGPASHLPPLSLSVSEPSETSAAVAHTHAAGFRLGPLSLTRSPQ